MPDKIRVIDSHTGGEPTRIIYDGGPDLGTGSIENKRDRFRENFDNIRKAVVTEPRGSDVLVGGLLLPPTSPESVAGIIFFNNEGYLGMCGHGAIGLMSTLKHLRRIEDGTHQIDTPVGPVLATLQGNETTLTNVASYRYAKDVNVNVPGFGNMIGDIAWGGNWFFLVKNYPGTLNVQNATTLTQDALAIRDALSEHGITGKDGAWIDHVEFFGPPQDHANDSRNFVLCPGGAYDRSPCGTGTSAKLACLAADDKLAPGKIWRQESIIGSVFAGSFQWPQETSPTEDDGPMIVPTITGTAFVSGEADLILNPADPFCFGIDS